MAITHWMDRNVIGGDMGRRPDPALLEGHHRGPLMGIGNPRQQRSLYEGDAMDSQGIAARQAARGDVMSSHAIAARKAARGL